MDSDRQYGEHEAKSRRETLAALGAGAVMVSGCQSSTSRSSPGEESQNKNEFVFPITGHATSEQAIQFNSFNATNSPWWGTQRMLFAHLAIKSASNYKWYPIAAKEMDVSDEVWTIHLRDNVEWHTGDSVTASDYVRQLKLSTYMGKRMSNYVNGPEDVTVADENVLKINLDSSYNPSSLTHYILSQNPIFASEAVFGRYLEQFQDSSTDSELESVQQELGQFNWTDPEPHMTGPLEIVDITAQGLILQSYPNYPTDDIQTDLRENTDGGVSFGGDDTQIEFSGNFYQSQNSVTQAAISGKIDGGAGISVKSERDLDRLPDDSEVRTSYNGNGISIIFNLIDGDDSEVWRDARVRKAFAYIIDLDEVANQFYGIYGDHNTKYSGLVPTLENKLFDDEYINSLEEYEQDFEKAETLLREAGLTFDGDWWLKPDGSELNPRFMAPTSVQFYVSGFQVAVSNLKSFGINAELNAVEGTSFFSQTIPNLNYGLTRGYYSHSEVPLAWRNSWVRYGGPSDETYSAYLQEPYDSTVVEVPPIGNPSSDERIEIDVLDRYDQIQHATETDEIRRISKELSWAFNQTVPRLPVAPAPSQWYLNHDGWQYPDKESPLGKPVNGLVWMLTQFGGIAPDE